MHHRSPQINICILVEYCTVLSTYKNEKNKKKKMQLVTDLKVSAVKKCSSVGIWIYNK